MLTVTFTFHLFWKSRGHSCLPLPPPIFSFILSRKGFDIPSASRFSSILLTRALALVAMSERHIKVFSGFGRRESFLFQFCCRLFLDDLSLPRATIYASDLHLRLRFNLLPLLSCAPGERRSPYTLLIDLVSGGVRKRLALSGRTLRKSSRSSLLCEPRVVRRSSSSLLDVVTLP